ARGTAPRDANRWHHGHHSEEASDDGLPRLCLITPASLVTTASDARSAPATSPVPVMPTAGIIGVLIVWIIAVIELRVRIEHGGANFSRPPAPGAARIWPMVLARLEETLIAGPESAQPEVDRRASSRSWRVRPVA